MDKKGEWEKACYQFKKVTTADMGCRSKDKDDEEKYVFWALSVGAIDKKERVPAGRIFDFSCANLPDELFSIFSPDTNSDRFVAKYNGPDGKEVSLWAEDMPTKDWSRFRRVY